jgi:hypothetical protein
METLVRYLIFTFSDKTFVKVLRFIPMPLGQLLNFANGYRLVFSFPTTDAAEND